MSAPTLARPVALVEAALWSARRGWAVFPCHHDGPRAKSPLTRHGHLDASRDEQVIRAWWDRWPLAMIGGAVPDALVAIDLDPRNGGSLEALEAATGPLPPTLTAWSGRGDGGRHLYYRRPAGTLSSTRLPAGIDVKAAGYCILPPSLHPVTGEPYRWDWRPVVSLPARAAGALVPPPRRPYVPRPGVSPDGAAAGLIRNVEQCPQGRRNSALHWSAHRALDDGLLDALPQLVAAAVAAGLPEREASRVVASAVNARGGTR